MSDDEDEKFLSQEEVMALITSLEIKYGGEIRAMLENIEADIKRYGHLSDETKKARKTLKNKILSERELIDGKPNTH